MPAVLLLNPPRQKTDQRHTTLFVYGQNSKPAQPRANISMLNMKKQLPTIMNLSAVSGLVVLGFTIIAPVLPQYALSFSIPLGLVGWAVSAFALARLVFNIPGGILADRFGRKRNMIIGLVIIIGSSVAAGSATEYGWLVAARVLQGIGSALYVTASTTWVAQVSAGEYRGRLMSLYSGLIFAATAFGPVIGGFAAFHFGIRAPFYVYGLATTIGLLATIPLKEPAETAEKSHSKIQLKDISTILLNKNFLLVCSSVLAVFFLRSSVRSTLIPIFSSFTLGLSEEKIGIILMAGAVATTAITLPAGWLLDKVGRKAPIMSSLLLGAVGVLLIPTQDSMGGLIWVMLFYGLATGLQGAIAAWPADIAPRDKMGTAMGLYRMIGDVGMFFGPLSVTYMLDATGDTGAATQLPFLIPAAIAVLAALAVSRAKDPSRQRDKL
ncbi:MFS transporter [Chloroflexota bacterium]